MTIYNRIFTICAAAILLMTASLALPDNSQAEDTKRTTVSDFSLKTLDGKTAKLSDHKGKVVVVAFWATWCKPCLQELRFLKQYYKDHKKDGLVVLAITTDGPDTIADVRSLVKAKRWKMPVLLDPDGEVLAKYNPRGTQPFSFFVDRGGKMALQHEGFAMGDETKYLSTIKKLLAEKP